ncbi:MAG: hypothetical protein VSS75_020940 [Candidatus Parabeggiatoa sp.]|nr:hypothetical protein [Candidatus Parabeggiatoa sp.]
MLRVSVYRRSIAFPDLMTYSYIKKIEPQNKFCTQMVDCIIGSIVLIPGFNPFLYTILVVIG